MNNIQYAEQEINKEDLKQKQMRRIYTSKKNLHKAIKRLIWLQTKKAFYFVFSVGSSYLLTAMILGAGHISTIQTLLIIFLNYFLGWFLFEMLKSVKEEEQE